MLSRESSASEQTWSLATYLRIRDVDAAFGQRVTRLPAIGVAPNQPYPTGVGKVWAIVTVAFFALGIGKCASASDTEKLNQQFTIPPTSAKVAPTLERPGGLSRYGPLTPPTEAADASEGSASDATGSVMFSPIFALEAGRNIAFELRAPVANNWMYAVIDLVNDDTGSVVSIEKSIEYYSGYDDGAWSEGSTHETEVIGPVAAGNYVLRVEAQHGGTAPIALSVAVHQGVFRWSWFGLGLIVLMVPFAFAGWRAHSFNRQRWSNSSLRGAPPPRDDVSNEPNEGDDDDDDD
jgi:hypothetical protein